MTSSKHLFGPYLRWLAVPALALLLVLGGCKKHEEAKAVVAAPLHAPAALTDDKAWQDYYQDVIGRNSQGVDGNTFPYYLPAPGGADYDDQYGRQLQGVSDSLQRGVLPGNMLAFMSPDSTKMADLVVAAFAKASPGSMKKVTVLFVGKPADNDRVKAAVEPTGATYKFVGFD
ncbi:MAG: hypothetical protein JSS44_10075 [Proteobacteria bacterium]|nr:hypothetical protein [Pseudomonadota bacterium]MBS0462369.1 hypothetical protein [Pseudomonadota bacterium]